MHKVSIKPRWTISDADGESLSPRLLELLAQVQQHGSLSGSCRHSGASYRHAWNLVRQGEQRIGAPLLRMERGKGSTLTPLGEKLVWAGRRIDARLTPLLESLASELEVEIRRVLVSDRAVLRVHSTHGYAVEKLLETLSASEVAIERKYVGSQEAVASLHDGACDLAGFHVTEGELESVAIDHYVRWFDLAESRIIHIATRRQGLMIAPGNPLKIYDLRDLDRSGVRFINRQLGSGTRFLLDCLFESAGIEASRIAGYEHGEYTHAAVAAYVASGMADAGFGIETPARRFKLDFLPMVRERYFLMCNETSLDTSQLQATLAVLRSVDYRQYVNELPGYTADRCGEVDTLQAAFPNYAFGKKTAPRRAVVRRGERAAPA